MVNWCQKFDIMNMKYVSMPNMVHARFAPGIYKSQNNCLYAFGGQQNSIEKINLLKKKSQWEMVQIEIPIELALGY
jgi:hypothetical protein